MRITKEREVERKLSIDPLHLDGEQKISGTELQKSCYVKLLLNRATKLGMVPYD